MKKAKRSQIRVRPAVVSLVDLAITARADLEVDPLDAGASNALKARAQYLAREANPATTAALLAQLTHTVAVFAARVPEPSRRELLETIRFIPESPQ